MSKWFEVTVTSTKIYAVEVSNDENAEDAIHYAQTEAVNYDEVTCSDEIIEKARIENLKNYADETISFNTYFI